MNSTNQNLDKSAENIIEDAERLLFDLAERGSFSQSFIKFNQAVEKIEMATQQCKVGRA